MKIWLVILFIFLGTFNALAQTHKLLFKTNKGNFKVLLYDFTPKHQQLILYAVKNKMYHDALFNRVIENFVVQGGAHDVDIAEQEKALQPSKRYRLPAEFDSRAFHKMGALGAGKDENDAKASFLNQIYFVVGKIVTNEELNALELKKGIKFSENQREIYLKNGGLPRLDNDYTVFGEVYEGLEVLLKISKVQTNEKDYPLEKIIFEITEI